MTHRSALDPPDGIAELDAARNYALRATVDVNDIQSSLVHNKLELERFTELYRSSSDMLASLIKESSQSLAALQDQANRTKTAYLMVEDQILDHRDLLVSPISVKSSNGAGAKTMTLADQLQTRHVHMKSLELTGHLFSYLAKAEELSLVTREQIKLATSEPAIQTFRELVQVSQSLLSRNSDQKQTMFIAKFVSELTESTWKELVKALGAKLTVQLDQLSWPSKKIAPGSLDYQYDKKARAFKFAFQELLRLEKVGIESVPPTLGEKIPREAPNIAIAALAQPVILRFRYHFDSQRKTNRLDKPEWYFAHILNAMSDNEKFIGSDIQQMLNENGLASTNAMNGFVAALLKPIYRKLQASVPQLLELPSVLAHTIYQALQFDSTLKETFSYKDPTGGVWKGTADVILGNDVWFTGWRAAVKKFTEGKYFDIIGSSNAWQINEDYAPAGSSILRPTNASLRIRDLFDQTTDRYRPLPEFKQRLSFFTEVQMPLLDSYISRIRSATDAFETLSFGLMRAVPGSLTGDAAGNTRLTNGVNGLQRLVRAGISAAWMEEVCKEWSEDVFFLDLWQDIREKSVIDASVRMPCQKLLDHRSKKAIGETSGVLDVFIEAFQALSGRIEELTVKHIVREVSSNLKVYYGRRWDESVGTFGDDEISPDLISSITIFSALLAVLSSSLPPVQLNRIYRSVCSQLQTLLITRSVIPKIWSEKGGKQFLFDVEYGWIAAAKQAVLVHVKRPENAFRKLLDSAKLVSLTTTTSATSQSASSQSPTDIVPISKVVQVTWDDTNDSAFMETMQRIGVRELSRDEVKTILRKRPECWR